MSTSQKNYWPYAIIMVFVSFGLYIGYFVYQSTKYDVNLVSEDYYEDEINFQERIESTKRGNQYLNEYHLQQNDEMVTVQLPSSLSLSSGNVTFFRPSDAHRDINIKLHANMAHTITIPKNKLGAGHWLVKTSIVSDGQHYFLEKPLDL